MNDLNLPDNWRVFPTAEAVANAAAQWVAEQAQSAIKQSGRFNLVAAGGTTPIKCYEQLKTMQQDWEFWQIFMGDERCLPKNDPERNSMALWNHWLHFGKIPSEAIHFIPTELGPDKAAERYEAVVQPIDWFDVTMLGMGEDGHTASLFPGHVYPEGRAVVIERNSPKPPPERVSLSYERLSQSRQVLKLITGNTKQAAVAKWLSGEDLPIARIKGQETHVFISEDALP
jgi:6-phosphogluconolactonase